MQVTKLAGLGLVMILMSAKCWNRHSFSFERSRNGSYIKFSSGDLNEVIKYDGKVQISEDETTIARISPNGYLMYKTDNDKLLIESNYHGELSYEVNDNGKKPGLDENGKKIMAQLVKEMIGIGFDAEARAERVYKKGGYRALLSEVDNLKADNIKAIYFERMIKSDSLPQDVLVEITKKISSQLGSDADKERILGKYAMTDLKSPETTSAYLDAVESLGSDNAKENLLSELIKNQAIQEERFDRLMEAINRLGPDNAKENLIRQLMEKNAIPSGHFDQVLEAIGRLGSDNAKANLFQSLIGNKEIPAANFDKAIQLTGRMGSDNEKANIYRKLIDGGDMNEDQWITVINAITQLGADNEKSNLLILTAGKMPASDNLKKAYIRAAKTINSDAEFGRAMKAME